MMAAPLKIGCVLMAAGNGSRFGSNKLAAKFRGKPLFQYALEAIPGQLFDQVVVVTQYNEFSDYVKDYHYTVILNSHPDSGISYTIHLGLENLQHCDGVLFMVADQPLLRQESVAALVNFWRSQPDSIAALSGNGKRGNPCLFPARLFPELMNLTGDSGGSSVIRSHCTELCLLEVPKKELLDVDTIQSLAELNQL